MVFSLQLILVLLPVFTNDSTSSEEFTVPVYTGEAMHYKLKYGIFNIGIALITCFEDSAGNGNIIRAEAQSAGLFRIIKDLDYRFECSMDPATGLPNSSIMNLRDGNTTSYSKVRFDHYSRADSSIILSEIKGECTAPKNIHDILTAYYYFRKNLYKENILSGLPVVIQTYLADMLWDLKIAYTGVETINTIYGPSVCQKFKASTVIGDFFRNDDDMTLWFTEDKYHIPVRIHLNLRLGSVTGDIVRYQKPINN